MVSRATLTIMVIPSIVAFAFSAWVFAGVIANSPNGGIGNCVEGCQHSDTLKNGINSNSIFSPPSSGQTGTQQKQVYLLAQYPTRLLAGQSGTFSAEPRGGDPPFVFEWDFGDGTKSDSRVSTHSYDREGNYYVIAKATDSKGNAGTLSLSITITKAQ